MVPAGPPGWGTLAHAELPTYYDCIQNELKQTFNETIGCLPPPLFPEPDIMCNRKFSSSSRGDEALLLLRSLYGHDYKFKCKTPCQTNKYSTRLYDKSNLPTLFPLTTLSIIFDKTVKVVQTKFSTDTETLLTGFGGSVSSGRTLLWILVSLLGASKVRFPFSLFKVSLICSPGHTKNKELHTIDQSAKIGPKSAKIGQNRPKSAKIGQNWGHPESRNCFQ